jgi:hypothetical protein
MGVVVVALAVDVQPLEDKGNAMLRLVVDVHWRHVVKPSIGLDNIAPSKCCMHAAK